MDLHEALIAVLNNFQELSQEEQDEIKEVFIPQSFKKGEYLTEYGKVNDNLAFVASGYCRVYVIDLEGNEVTIHIAGNVDFIGAISSFIMRKPSEEYVQAITDTEILFLGYNELQKLYAKSKTWEHIGRLIMEGLFLRKQLRVISFIKMTAEERYLYLLMKKPDLILNVPMQYVASFLGVTPETLSRIRARIT